jgi:glutamyl/glutaminyl-tRNA synthetase
MVVTRFAPSPTGYLHIGGARTALFNWLWARRSGGKFVLRIEDTDVKRNTPEATRQVIRDLRWLGIDWDEGPEAGGPNGPYFQSERLDIYNEYLGKLIKSGKAYYCFDTPEELDVLRKQAEAKKETFLYPRPSTFPDENEVNKAKAEGKSVVVRFAVPRAGPIVVQDTVRGEVNFEPSQISDFIIVKSDGYPTYNFACVVDDELMGVTHVIRGQEHLMNTPGQQCIQDALGFRRPVYAHMSVTISESGGKLSKRERGNVLREAVKNLDKAGLERLAGAGNISLDEIKEFVKGKGAPDMAVIDAMAEFLGVRLPEINVVDFFKSGYIPEAMVNFLAMLGWSPADDREVMSADELIDAFSLERLTKSNSLFDRQKLVAFNTEHIRRLGLEKLLHRLREYVDANNSPLAQADDAFLTRLIKVNEGARTLADIDRKCRFLFVADEQIEYDEKAVKKVLLAGEGRGLAMLRIVREKLAALKQITAENMETMLRSLAEQKQVGLGKVAQPLRVAICGTTISPPIFDSVDMLGKEKTLVRIDRALKKFGR